MNAERLHAIVNGLAEDLAATNTPALVRQLANALQQSAQDPSQQQTASSVRQQLEEALSSASSDKFSPAWRQSLEELGVADLFGSALLAQIEAILARNEITPSAAAADLTPIADRLDGLNDAIEQLRPGFEFFNVGAEDLAPGEFEIGFLIPRQAVDDELQELGDEFARLKRILGPFLELATGSRDDVHVRSLASSEFQVFLDSAPTVAALIAMAVERLIASYANIMNIRIAHQQLKDSGMSEAALAPIKSEADSMMKQDIGQLVDELLTANQQADQGRANELRTELISSLNALANRIDRGYGVEVRAGEVPEPDEEAEESDEERERREAAHAVLERQRRIQFRNLTGQPILQLPEATEPGPSRETAS
jgi:hypothetical protein